MRGFWTKRRDRVLLKFWGTLSASQIAGKLGTTKNAVIGRIARLQGRYGDYVSANEMVARARSKARREARMKINEVAIAKLKHDLSTGLERDAAIRSALNSGATQTSIGHFVGVSRQRIQQIEKSV